MLGEKSGCLEIIKESENLKDELDAFYVEETKKYCEIVEVTEEDVKEWLDSSAWHLYSNRKFLFHKKKPNTFRSLVNDLESRHIIKIRGNIYVDL